MTYKTKASGSWILGCLQWFCSDLQVVQVCFSTPALGPKQKEKTLFMAKGRKAKG